MIHLLFTGGTISMHHDPAAGGNVPAHDGEQLVSLVPGLERISPFRIENWARLPAAHLGPERLWALRSRVCEIQAEATGGKGPNGIVITHGTDTIEETAYLLARTLDPAVPVAITGAMRTSSDADWDGPRNLRDAATVAASPASAGRGAMVVFAGNVFAGHEAVKTDTVRLDAFSAPHGAAVGRVKDGRVEYGLSARPPVRLSASRPARLSAPDFSPRVALVPMVIGDRGELLDLARPGHDGVVIVAFGSGNLPPGAIPAIRRWLDDGKPVVLASRCPTGVVTPVYAFEGGGAGLVALGVVPAGPRTPSQARLELVLALSAGVSYGE
jgi:L-asparaginase